MKNFRSIWKLSILFLIVPFFAFPHGWSEYPNARQNICYEQGGIWSGSPPNKACSNAKDKSGTYPFVQKNEFSINILDYNNIDMVKKAIPDGTLCYANDSAKTGMGLSSTEWTRTIMQPGTFEFVFNATVAHNPSFWEFYLTTEDADLSGPLAWGDLELIKSVDNIPVVGGKYKTDITLPEGRDGNAIFFVRWQRDDSAGEGFYNCSDITIKSDSGVILPDPDPDYRVKEPNLVQGELFIPSDLSALSPGNVAIYDILNNDEKVINSFEFKITSTNLFDWKRLFASEINGWHEKFQNGDVFIGDWHKEMNHYMYFKSDDSRNYFNSLDADRRGVLSIIKGSTETNTDLIGELYELVISDKEVMSGEKLLFVFDQPTSLEQTQGTQLDIINNGTNSVLIDTSVIQQQEALSFTAYGLDSKSTKTFNVKLVVDGYGDWDASKIYTSGDVVTFNGLIWEAQWWSRGEKNPQITFENNKWGVWRPSN